MATNNLTGRVAPQGQVTTIVSVPYSWIKSRLNANDEPTTAYGGGRDPLNLRYTKNDVLVGLNKDTFSSVGRAQETAIPSLNGLALNSVNSLFDLQRTMHFVGVNKTDYDPLDPAAPKSGLATIRTGTVDVNYTHPTLPIYPGDKVCWYLPPISGGANSVYQADGKPKSKIPVGLKPLAYDDLQHVETYFATLATLDKNGGVASRTNPFASDITSDQKCAILLKDRISTMAMLMVHTLVKQGHLIPVTPSLSVALKGKIIAADDEIKLTAAINNIYGETKPAEDNTPVSTVVDLISKNGVVTAQIKAKCVVLAAQRQDEGLYRLALLLGVINPSETASPETIKVQSALIHATHPSIKLASSQSHLLQFNLPNVDSINKQYKKRAVDMQVKYQLEFANYLAAVNRTIIGTSYSYQTPGANHRIDINLGEK